MAKVGRAYCATLGGVVPVDGRETPTRTVLPRSHLPSYFLFPFPESLFPASFHLPFTLSHPRTFSVSPNQPPFRPPGLLDDSPGPSIASRTMSIFPFLLSSVSLRFTKRSASRCRWVNTDTVWAIFAWGGRKEWSYSKSATAPVPPFQLATLTLAPSPLPSTVQFLVATTVQSFWSETTRNIMPPLESTVQGASHTSYRALVPLLPVFAGPPPLPSIILVYFWTSFATGIFKYWLAIVETPNDYLGHSLYHVPRISFVEVTSLTIKGHGRISHFSMMALVNPKKIYRSRNFKDGVCISQVPWSASPPTCSVRDLLRKVLFLVWNLWHLLICDILRHRCEPTTLLMVFGHH